jgi:hypothetical protein
LMRKRCETTEGFVYRFLDSSRRLPYFSRLSSLNRRLLRGSQTIPRKLVTYRVNFADSAE